MCIFGEEGFDRSAIYSGKSGSIVLLYIRGRVTRFFLLCRTKNKNADQIMRMLVCNCCLHNIWPSWW